MLFLFQVPDDSNLLQQIAFTSDEVKYLFQNHATGGREDVSHQQSHKHGSHQSCQSRGCFVWGGGCMDNLCSDALGVYLHSTGSKL